MHVEANVADHYTHGALQEAIFAGLRASGKNPETVTIDDLADVDEFHMGWRAATAELANDLDLSPGMSILDIGCGIGGPARYIAQTFGNHVTGIDLTAEFVDVANTLTRLCRLSDRATFRQASALDMPFADASFDRAMMIHVGMNIGDKAGLFAQARRVLRPGGLFCVYDVMRIADGELHYPMLWARTDETSFVETPQSYSSLLSGAGFAVISETSRRDMSLRLALERRAEVERNGLPPLGLHTLIGEAAAHERLGNVFTSLAAATIAPVQLLARAI
jgi:SAM-dependent methyltransferase